MAQYLLVSNKPWGIEALKKAKELMPEQEWQLEDSYVEGRDAIFFLHYGKTAPDFILNSTPCFGFHLAPLPYGRGGSPLQNMIARGEPVTWLTMFRMKPGKVDSGPILMRECVSLRGRSAEEIYLEAQEVSLKLIKRYLNGSFIEHEQDEQDAKVTFKRRKPEESSLVCADYSSLEKLFDHIRMLDAETYPKAYLYWNGVKIEFSRAALRLGRIDCDVKITVVEE